MATSRFGKSLRNQGTERDAQSLVLRNLRFQRPDRATKRRILELLDVRGDFTDQTFDLVMTPRASEPLTVQNVATRIEEMVLIEVKSTKKAIRDIGLARFFYGTTDRQRQLARALPDRYRYAFVVLSADNAYGRPFFTLLTPSEVEESIHSERLQYQVSFRTDLQRQESPERGPFFEITDELAKVARAEVEEPSPDD